MRNTQTSSFRSFIAENIRWIFGGFALTFSSSYGQTFFISLSAADIRGEYGLSHGEFGSIYMIATLASALTLPFLGRIVDIMSVAKTVVIIVPLLALSCVSMAYSTSIIVLLLTIYGLRLFGQGMMTHIAMTAMGKWFAAQRGRAVSVSSIGINFGEALYPTLFVLLASFIGWRNSWLVGAGILVCVALPLIYWAMHVEREPRSSDPTTKVSTVRDWTHREVLRDPLFYIILAGVLAPAFIATSIFFHQVYLVELRGWSLEVFASSFVVMSSTTVIFSLISGYLVDKLTAKRLLPLFLVPLAIACIIIAFFEAQGSIFLFMMMMGVSYGFSSTLFGSLWPEIYGTAHLGAIRSITVSAMVFGSAIGPGITGILIDQGIDFPIQLLFMGVYCFGVALVLFFVSKQLQIRSAPINHSS